MLTELNMADWTLNLGRTQAPRAKSHSRSNGNTESEAISALFWLAVRSLRNLLKTTFTDGKERSTIIRHTNLSFF